MKNLTILFSLLGCGFAAAQDMALNQVLIDGEDWQLVSEGHGFSDACCSDANGNFYFTDVKNGTGIFKIDAAGKQTLFIDNLPGISGLQFGPDGRLFACQNKAERVIAIHPDGKIDELVKGVRPNDLVVTSQGAVYFTHTKPQKIEYISPSGEHKTVHEGSIVRPNGITLSPDQGTLIVSDHGGKNVWAFRINPDGTLSFPEPYMDVRTPAGTDESKGDGSTTDAYGRYYVTADVGLHMYDPTGRLGGVIRNPAPQCVSVEFGGPNLEYLYAAASGKIYRRKTASQGLLFQNAPVKRLDFKAK